MNTDIEIGDLEPVRAGLARDLLAWMAEAIPAPGTPADNARFESLALRVFAYQFAANAAYRRFCERRGVRPDSVRRWQDIPTVATDAFKEVPLTCFPPEQAVIVFETSGTTRQIQRGRHYLRTLDLYEASLLPAFHAHLLPDNVQLPTVILGFSPEAMPRSSLSHMFGVVTEGTSPWPSGPVPLLLERDIGDGTAADVSTLLNPSPVGEGLGERSRPSPCRRPPWGEGAARYFLTPAGLDLDGAITCLAQFEETGLPVLLMGTAFAFVHVLDNLTAHGRRLRLPPGSRLMDTGGYKGRSREAPKAELYGLYTDVLGIAPDHVVNEYGMTEMGSQFYDGVLRGLRPRRKQSPPWVRTIVADPETLEPLPHGHTGVLRHYDLANLDSVMALQTADLGFADEHGFEITGRAAGAEARGCSLAVEELLSAQR